MTVTQITGSSLISAIGYDEENRTLAVTFTTNGATYHYPNVTKQEYEDFLNNPLQGSHGKHFHQFFKKRGGVRV